MVIRTVSNDEKTRLRESGIFDEQWYCSRYPDVRASGMDPAEHYLMIGVHLNRQPGPLPAERRTGEGAVIVPKSSIAAMERHLLNDRAHRVHQQFVSVRQAHDQDLDVLHARTASAIDQAMRQRIGMTTLASADLDPIDETVMFHADWVKSRHGTVGSISLDRLFEDHTLRFVDPHPLFSVDFYLVAVPDAAKRQHPLQHYLRVGWREGRDPHPLFCNDWYLAQNPILVAKGGVPLAQYLSVGWRLGQRPNPVFDPVDYLRRYPDVADAGIEPLSHFVMHGLREGRDPLPHVGLSSSLMSGMESSHPWGLMGHLLRSAPHRSFAGEIESAILPTDLSGPPWPPPPVNDFWLPQTLRDLIISAYGEDAVYTYWYLCSVMATYRDAPDSFPDSPEFATILARLKSKARMMTETQRNEIAATVIVPVYNNLVDTLLCLATVLETAGKCSFEVIVADDGSSDATAEVISAIGGCVIHHRQPINLGFLGNCNAAATHGRGRHIVLLNNDTLVMPGWLDELLEPFDQIANVGFVGSKLINWDGSLQEAGGIYWEDGSAWNFGRNQDARAPQFNYVKDVDYCSGASIAVPRELWQRLGGFDTHYMPAYCEDADLAFRVRAIGYRTLYQPLSEVIHHEGRSHGRDTSAGIKAFQVANQRKLVERWSVELKRDHYPNAENVFRARDRTRNKHHVLVVDHYVPQWDQDAGSRSMYQYIKAFQEIGFAVTFWPDNLWYDPKYAPALQKMAVEVIYGPAFRDGFEQFIAERANLYDTVFLSRPHIAENYVDAVRRHSNARVIYYGHDLHFRRMEAQRALTGEGDPDAIARMRDSEVAVCRKCDIIFYPDPKEVQTIRGEVSSAQRVINNPVYVYDKSHLDLSRGRLDGILTNDSKTLLFVGGFGHAPNVDGITWFVHEVMPLVEKRFPGVRLTVAGSKPPAEVRSLARRNVEVLGFVSDEQLVTLYRETELAVAPLRFGAGVKGKVLEAMANAVPMATTSTGAQGVWVAERALFLGDRPVDLAAAITLALTDRIEARRRAAAALDFMSENHSSEYLGRLLLEVSLV